MPSPSESLKGKRLQVSEQFADKILSFLLLIPMARAVNNRDWLWAGFVSSQSFPGAVSEKTQTCSSSASVGPPRGIVWWGGTYLCHSFRMVNISCTIGLIWIDDPKPRDWYFSIVAPTAWYLKDLRQTEGCTFRINWACIIYRPGLHKCKHFSHSGK